MMAQAARVVDPDDPGTWPSAVRKLAERSAAVLDGSASCAADLPVPSEAAESFMELIGDGLLRAYHCTRLLAEEAADVRRRGLVPLSAALVESRVRAACGASYLTAAEAGALVSGSALAAGSERGRLAQVCAVAGRSLFDGDPGAAELLLSVWGGEAIYWAHERTALGARLRSLGTPSIVAVNLRLTAHTRAPKFFPPLARLLVGQLLGLPESWGDVFYFGPVAAEDIEAIWQPGYREYDRHEFLPRS